jgi:hypothetical protein
MTGHTAPTVSAGATPSSDAGGSNAAGRPASIDPDGTTSLS